MDSESKKIEKILNESFNITQNTKSCAPSKYEKYINIKFMGF